MLFRSTSLAGHDFVRLKVVYPNSRLTTAIRLRYNIELIPGGSTVSQSLSNASANGSDSLQLTSWLNYTAYRTSDYARYHTDPSVRIDLDTRRDAIMVHQLLLKIVIAGGIFENLPGYVRFLLYQDEKNGIMRQNQNSIWRCLMADREHIPAAKKAVYLDKQTFARSEERRVGKECGS